MPYSRRLDPSHDHWWGDLFQIPHDIADKNSGKGIFKNDFVMPSVLDNYNVAPRQHMVRHDATSRVKDDDMFIVSLDVHHFKPGEITVKTVNNSVVIHGKHEEKEDEHGHISREFTRRYELPKEVLPETITSSLTVDGFLVVQGPKKAFEQPKRNERVVKIPITEKDPAIKENPEEKTKESK